MRTTAAILIAIALTTTDAKVERSAAERPATERLVQSILDANLLRGAKIVIEEYLRGDDDLRSDRVVHRECRDRRLRNAGILNRAAEARVEEILEVLRALPHVYDAPAAFVRAGGV